MKKLALLLTLISLTTMSAMATEPLLLEPLSPAVLSGTKPVTVPAPDAKMVYKYQFQGLQMQLSHL